MRVRWLSAALIAAFACRSGGPSTPPGAPGAPGTAESRTASTRSVTAAIPSAIRWTRDSAEHEALFLEVYRAAAARVEQASASRLAGSWAVVLDADETVIDNSVYQLERARVGLPFDPLSWRAWTARREAVPLPGAASFLTRVRQLGGRIAIVTNRTTTECPDTEAVFRANALPYDVMLCMPDGGSGDKNPRFEAVAAGTTPAGLPPLEILAFVGDNVQDFPGQSQSLRDRGETAFTPFGQRFFLLPNPMYGSWERR